MNDRRKKNGDELNNRKITRTVGVVPVKIRDRLGPWPNTVGNIPVGVLVDTVLERQGGETESICFAHVVLILANVTVTF